MLNLKLLSSELLLFALIQFLGIYAASVLILRRPEILATPEISLAVFTMIFLLSVLFIFLAMRFVKHRIGFKLLFVFLIVIGSKAIFSAFFSDLVASILALAIVALWVALPYVLIHNITLIFAIAGISTELGFALSFGSVLILLGLLSVYDVIAVYRTKHMVKMFTGLMEKGLILSLVIPITKSWLTRTETVRPRQGFLLLGTGDIAFPLIFAVSVVKISIMSSLFIAVGATIGAALVFYLLIHQTQRRAIPALPPIALCSIAGFLVSLLL